MELVNTIAEWLKNNTFAAVLSVILILWIIYSYLRIKSLKSPKNDEIERIKSIALYVLSRTNIFDQTKRNKVTALICYSWLYKESNYKHPPSFGKKSEGLIENMHVCRSTIKAYYQKVVLLPYEEDDITELLSEIGLISTLSKINFIEEYDNLTESNFHKYINNH